MAAAEDSVTAQSKPNPSNLATTFVNLAPSLAISHRENSTFFWIFLHR